MSAGWALDAINSIQVWGQPKGLFHRIESSAQQICADIGHAWYVLHHVRAVAGRRDIERYLASD